MIIEGIYCVFARIRCGGITILICAASLVSYGQSAPNQSLRPPGFELLPVHSPVLNDLEPEVRRQLISVQVYLTAALETAPRSNEKLSQSYGAMGEIYQAYSFLAAARECYLNAARLSSNDFRWIYLLAYLDQLDGHFDEAVRVLRPEYVATSVNLGNIYLQLDRLDEADKSFQTALTIDRDSAAANFGLGQVALSKRSYEAAIYYFEKALAQVPDANRIHYSLAMAYRGLGEVEKARAQLAQQGPVGVRGADTLVDALQELIQGARMHLVRGKRAFAARRYAEAAIEFRKAIASQPESVEAHLNLAGALTETGDLRGAINEFQAVVQLDSHNSVAHYNLAVLFRNANDHASAIAHLRSVLKIDENDSGARLLLAQELFENDRLEEAQAEFSRVIRTDPDNESAVLQEVSVLLRMERYRQALDSLEKAHALYPRKEQTAITLAYLLASSPEYNLRDGARALKLAQGVYETTGSVTHGAVVGLALAELNRCDEAAAWLQKMLGRNSENQSSDIVSKLKAQLSFYEHTRPCRPSELIILQTAPLVR